MEGHSNEEFHVLVRKLKLFDHKFFFNKFCMTPEQLDKILAMVAPRIMRHSLCREAIGLRERICIALRYLASGDLRIMIADSPELAQ